MAKKIRNTALITLSIIALISLLVYITFDISNNIKSKMKKDGFDVVLSNADICTMTIDGNTLWAGGSSGLYKINMNTMTSVKVGDYKFVRSVLFADGTLWVGYENGLAGIGKTNCTITTKDGLPDNRVNAIIIDKYKQLWIGTWGGAAVFTNKVIRTYTIKDGLLANMVNVLMQDSSGSIWFGSYVAPRGGISILRDGKWQYFTTNDALEHANINTIIQRKDNRVIAGGGLYTNGGGTYFDFKIDKWQKTGTISKKDGLAGEKVRSLFEDSLNRLWVGSEYDGLVIMQGSAVLQKLTVNDGLPNNEVKVICEDKNRNIWIGTRAGLLRISIRISN
ncbi:MAG: two-component regulator propeller domain-containing protein [Clostridia bacterium]|jgi:ligand-binding sensor domain-containing protein